MSTVVTDTTTFGATGFAKPSYFGLVRGELFKIRKQWATWITLAVMIGILCLPFLVVMTVRGNNLQDQLNHGFLMTWASTNLSLFRAVSGFVLLILASRAIGQEYSQGTIRLLLGRGVGRMQFLLAKLTAVAIWAIIYVLIGLALNALLDAAMLGIKVGNFDVLNNLPTDFWHDLGIDVLTILLNMGVTILLAAVLSVLGRSIAFGMTASILFFPVDNIVGVILLLAFTLTSNQFWLNITAYLLGPNLNIMPRAILGTVRTLGTSPAVAVDGTHTIAVALVYAAIFATVAFSLTWKRDVKE